MNLNQEVTFYNPHPGFAGAAIPIPIMVKRVADELNGQKLLLKRALEKLKKVTKGKLRVVAMDINFILLEIKRGKNAPQHGFRVICFK